MATKIRPSVNWHFANLDIPNSKKNAITGFWCEYFRIGSLVVTGVVISATSYRISKRLARTVLIFTERSDQLSRVTDRVPGLPA
ncbi:hypothetical protein ACVSTZ_21475, partial [Yersinia enterocolitica]